MACFDLGKRGRLVVNRQLKDNGSIGNGGINEDFFSCPVIGIFDRGYRQLILIGSLCCTPRGDVRNGQHLRIDQGQEVLWRVLCSRTGRGRCEKEKRELI